MRASFESSLPPSRPQSLQFSDHELFYQPSPISFHVTDPSDNIQHVYPPSAYDLPAPPPKALASKQRSPMDPSFLTPHRIAPRPLPIPPTRALPIPPPVKFLEPPPWTQRQPSRSEEIQGLEHRRLLHENALVAAAAGAFLADKAILKKGLPQEEPKDLEANLPPSRPWWKIVVDFICTLF